MKIPTLKFEEPKTQTFDDLQIDHTYHIKEGVPKPTELQIKAAPFVLGKR